MTATLTEVDALTALTATHQAAHAELTAARAVADAAEAEFGEYSPEHTAAAERVTAAWVVERGARRAVKAAGGVPVDATAPLTYPVGPDSWLAHWTDDVPTEVLAQWRRERRSR